MTGSIQWNVLLIDDDPDFREVTALALKDAGYHVTTAENGRTGIDLCKRVSPQIVITDLRMPGIDGLQTLKQIRKACPKSEVIVMTSFGETAPATTALQHEAADFITKPVHDDTLFIALKRAQRNYLLNINNGADTSSADKSDLRERLIESSMDMAMVCDENGLIVAINDAGAELLGFSKAETLLGMPLKAFFPTAEWASFKTALSDEDYGESRRLDLFETLLKSRSGARIPVRISANELTCNQKNSGLVVYCKDLRERKILCDQWIALIDQLNIGAFTIDMSRRITAFNQSAQSLTGLNETDVIGRDCRDVFGDIPCNAKCPCHVRSERSSGEGAVEITDRSDVRHLVTRLSAPLYGPGNRIAGCLTILQDHAAFADLINRVNHEERSLKMILDNLDIGIFTVNRGCRITFFNQAAEIISGYPRRRVLGRSSTIIFKDGDTVDADMLKESINLGEPRTNRQSSIVTPDGEVVPIRADYIPLHNDQGRIVGGLATIQDLTLAQQFNQMVSEHYTFHSMIGKEPAMQKIFQMAGVVAESEAAVLIEGATGTGKDLLARVIHSASHRADMPLVNVNCAALPDNLLESELFGYIKGAFTGADKNKPGRFQDADGGTIFLDEIGDLPLSLQAKLLQVLESKEFYPLGSRTPVKVDVRIISASNRGLESLVKQKLFREDLFYRLNVIQIELPLLKDRRADIPLLIRHILRKLSIAKGFRVGDISKKALEILFNYDYPGNVRELHNILEHALIISGDEMITPDHLPLSMRNRIAAISTDVPVQGRTNPEDPEETEKKRLLRMLDKYNWHRNRTAAALGMDRTTLWRKMKRLGLASFTSPSRN